MQLSYIDSATGIPVVILHGVGNSKKIAEPFCDIFSREGYRVIAFDLPGHGESPALENISHKKLVSAMAEAVVENLKGMGVDSFALVGISFGGSIAMEIVKKYKEKVIALALQGPPVHGKDLGFTTRLAYKFLYQIRRPVSGPKILYFFANKISPLYEWATRKCTFSVVKDKLGKNYSRELDIDFWALCVRALMDIDARGDLKNFHAPILLVDGSSPSYKFTDTTSKLTKLISKNRNGNVLEAVLVPGVGHELPEAKPYKFAGIIIDFLKRNTST